MASVVRETHPRFQRRLRRGTFDLATVLEDRRQIEVRPPQATLAPPGALRPPAAAASVATGRGPAELSGEALAVLVTAPTAKSVQPLIRVANGMVTCAPSDPHDRFRGNRQPSTQAGIAFVAKQKRGTGDPRD